jgi:hypothetical protein
MERPVPAHFEAATEMAGEEDVAEAVVHDPARVRGVARWRAEG